MLRSLSDDEVGNLYGLVNAKVRGCLRLSWGNLGKVDFLSHTNPKQGKHKVKGAGSAWGSGYHGDNRMGNDI